MIKLMKRKDSKGELLPNWYCQITLNGKRHIKSLGTTSKKEAELVAQLKLANLEKSNGLMPNAIPTLSRACDRMYREVWQHNTDSMNSIRKIKAIIDIVGDLKLNQINSNVVADIECKLSDSKLSQATVNRYKTALLSVLNRARDTWQVLETIPKISKVKETGVRERLLSVLEEDTLVKCLSNLTESDIKYNHLLKRYHDVSEIIILLVDTGMRLGEVLNLTTANFDLEYNIINLTGLMCKSDKGRSIPMTHRVKTILATKNGSGIIYAYNKEQVIRIFHWSKAKCNIQADDLVLHSLRHTFACRVLRKGASLKQVKDLLGHADFKTTERYARYEISNLQQAISLLD